MKRMLPLALLALTACNSYRHYSGPDDRLSEMYIATLQMRPDASRGVIRPYVQAHLASAPRERTDSNVVAGGTDEWYGLAGEVEAGGLASAEKGRGPWIGAGVQLSLLRLQGHRSGPAGGHDHATDSHSSVVLGGLGVVARVGWDFRITDHFSIGPEFAFGFVPAGGLSGERYLEIGIIGVRW